MRGYRQGELLQQGGGNLGPLSPGDPGSSAGLGKTLLGKVVLSAPKVSASSVGSRWGGLLVKVDVLGTEGIAIVEGGALGWELRPEKDLPAGGVHDAPVPLRLLLSFRSSWNDFSSPG